MDLQTFQGLAQRGHNRIPVHREILSDLDTPLSVYLKLADGPHSYLFESVQGGEQWGRFSIIGLPCSRVYRVFGNRWVEAVDGVVVAEREVEDPLAEVDALIRSENVARPEGLPQFCGGLVGYFGYETIAYIERRLAGSGGHDELGLPDILLMESVEVAVFDNLSGRLYVIVTVDPSTPHAWQRAQRRLDQIEYRLRAAGHGYPEVIDPRAVSEKDFVSGFSREAFEAAVRRSRNYIAAGDIMQVVLSQRMTVPFRARPVDVYRALRSLNPSPYLFFLDLDDAHVVGSSPEILVRVEAGEVVVRPIAGTRPRGATPAADRALEAELLSDPKELAEHLMLIDLGRNDVGRVARTGTVRLTDRMVIERYSHVMHIVSEVRGQLDAGLGAIDVLRAAFPAGTLSGAPKIRAMEIIQELEPVKRGVYGGAVGYLGWWGDADTAIAIRTAVIQEGQLHVQAGAGIVHDSDPATEWEETMSKGRALFRAVAQAAGGL
ncbi:MAG: anthranilate synthase component I [Pseudomonadota bacterium]